MKRRPRSELIGRFGEGTMPSANDFGMLIESTMNILDDGIEHTPERGLCLTQMNGKQRRLLSFYREGMARAWALGLDAACSTMAFEVARPDGGQGRGRAAIDGKDSGDGGGRAVLTLLAPADDELARPRVGINKARPAYELDVAGTVASSGRRGAEGPAAYADGEWHTIRDGLEGCVQLEVVAGTGKRESGKYALMHAFAAKIFDAKGQISYHQAHYGSRRHRIELQWLQEKNSPTYALQIRVNCKYGDQVRLRYHITELWDDPMMALCAGAAPAAGMP